MPHASFYILSADKQPLDFTCQLTQTVLNKSDDGLAIFCPDGQLANLDDKLWAFSAIAFIPHNILTKDDDNHPAMGVILTADIGFICQFDGIVINLTDDALPQFNGSRLLEIISDDKKALARDKYRAYHNSGWQLNSFEL